jgi:ferredoxin
MLGLTTATSKLWRKAPVSRYMLACFSSHDPPPSNKQVEDYLTSIGVGVHQQPELLQSIGKVLRGNTAEITVTEISNNFSKEDLLELSNAIQKQRKKLRRKDRRLQRTVFFRISQQGGESALNWKFGQSLLDLAQSSPGQHLLEGLDHMEGPCGGQMSCSTCHVYLDPKTYQALPPPTEQELDMLDLAFEPKETSRLGCQVKFDNILNEKVGAENHDIVVTLPSGVNNEWEG